MLDGWEVHSYMIIGERKLLYMRVPLIHPTYEIEPL